MGNERDDQHAIHANARIHLLLAIVLCCGGCVYLKVTSDPEGAAVHINGKSAGETQMEVSLGAVSIISPTEIEVEKDGYFTDAGRIGWWESWFWIYGTTKTRHFRLIDESMSVCSVCGEPVSA